jgi:hypothetical protein
MLSLSITGVTDTSGELTLAWLTPVANYSRRRWHRWQINAFMVYTGGKLTPAWLTSVAN